MSAASLSVSIVTFATDLDLLHSTLSSLRSALNDAWNKGALDCATLYLIDNGPSVRTDPEIVQLLEDWGHAKPEWRHVLITGQGNVGYGSGHNLAIHRAESDYHLVLNPDVGIMDGALTAALEWMEVNTDVCLLSPLAVDQRGRRQYLCKRYPAMFDLLLRGFAPAWLNRYFHRRLEHYEMRDLDNSSTAHDVPIVSGCFMLFRSDALKNLDGFERAFFLYFEDFDLSLRAGRWCRVMHVPSVRIVHHGGQAATKGWRHIRLFVASMLRFYRRHGWKFL